MIVLFNQSLKTGIVYDQSSCIKHEIAAKNNIQSVIYMDSLKIITLSDTDEIELFKI
jgi:NAD kinase